MGQDENESPEILPLWGGPVSKCEPGGLLRAVRKHFFSYQDSLPRDRFPLGIVRKPSGSTAANANDNM
jgi:hypothetical protein